MLPKLKLREAMRSISQIKALSLLAPNARPVVQSLMRGIHFKKVPNPDPGKSKMPLWHHRCEVQSTEVAFACLLCMLDNVQEGKTCARH